MAGLPRSARLLADLPALPGTGGEAENFDLDAATLQRAGENVGAGGGHRDRSAAHGARIVDQQRDHRVAELVSCSILKTAAASGR
jgi:hypothetical protein